MISSKHPERIEPAFLRVAAAKTTLSLFAILPVGTLLNFETNEIYVEYTSDGGHLTHEGYLVLTGEIKTVINKVMTENFPEK